MLYNNNSHVHVWGEGDKGCFCLVCGHFMPRMEMEGEMSYMMPMVDPMWPDKKPDPEADIEEGSMMKKMGM